MPSLLRASCWRRCDNAEPEKTFLRSSSTSVRLIAGVVIATKRVISLFAGSVVGGLPFQGAGGNLKGPVGTAAGSFVLGATDSCGLQSRVLFVFTFLLCECWSLSTPVVSTCILCVCVLLVFLVAISSACFVHFSCFSSHSWRSTSPVRDVLLLLLLAPVHSRVIMEGASLLYLLLLGKQRLLM